MGNQLSPEAWLLLTSSKKTARIIENRGNKKVVFPSVPFDFSSSCHVPWWSPLGASRFLNLVRTGYHDGCGDVSSASVPILCRFR
jgi:hypothetical protein